jgi:hypothetical protein
MDRGDDEQEDSAGFESAGGEPLLLHAISFRARTGPRRRYRAAPPGRPLPSNAPQGDSCGLGQVSCGL